MAGLRVAKPYKTQRCSFSGPDICEHGSKHVFKFHLPYAFYAYHPAYIPQNHAIIQVAGSAVAVVSVGGKSPSRLYIPRRILSPDEQ